MPVVFKDPRFQDDWSIWNIQEPFKKANKSRTQKLTIQDVVEIRRILKERGHIKGTKAELARKYGVVKQTISKIYLKQRWNDSLFLNKNRNVIEKLEPEFYEQLEDGKT
jgi:DNA-binding XRE family transcriptional regulator